MTTLTWHQLKILRRLGVADAPCAGDVLRGWCVSYGSGPMRSHGALEQLGLCDRESPTSNRYRITAAGREALRAYSVVPDEVLPNPLGLERASAVIDDACTALHALVRRGHDEDGGAADLLRDVLAGVRIFLRRFVADPDEYEDDRERAKLIYACIDDLLGDLWMLAGDPRLQPSPSSRTPADWAELCATSDFMGMLDLSRTPHLTHAERAFVRAHAWQQLGFSKAAREFLAHALPTPGTR